MRRSGTSVQALREYHGHSTGEGHLCPVSCGPFGSVSHAAQAIRHHLSHRPPSSNQLLTGPLAKWEKNGVICLCVRIAPQNGGLGSVYWCCLELTMIFATYPNQTNGYPFAPKGAGAHFTIGPTHSPTPPCLYPVNQAPPSQPHKPFFPDGQPSQRTIISYWLWLQGRPN
mmetsp:Transcript_2014/g.3955  ORF Transcript_2014/g.3955 Transcript_2014/m.3955 type:complete len:170 (-) Transcript_2014:839-1348(-)